MAKEISKKSNSLRQELYAQYLVDRVTLAIHALRHLVKEEDLTEQLGDIFRWRSGLLDDIWTDDGETMCLQPLLLLSSTHVRQDLNLTIDQIKQCSALNNKWKKIQRNNEGEDFQRQTELTHELVDDIKTNFLTEEQRERYGQLVKQRFLLADDLLTTVRLLKLEIPKEKREAFNAEMMNFHLCIGAIQHLRRYSMRFPLIEDHLDAKKLSALTRYQFIPCGSFGGKPKLPEAFSDLVAAKPKPINPRRQRR